MGCEHVESGPCDLCLHLRIRSDARREAFAEAVDVLDKAMNELHSLARYHNPGVRDLMFGGARLLVECRAKIEARAKGE